MTPLVFTQTVLYCEQTDFCRRYMAELWIYVSTLTDRQSTCTVSSPCTIAPLWSFGYICWFTAQRECSIDLPSCLTFCSLDWNDGLPTDGLACGTSLKAGICKVETLNTSSCMVEYCETNWFKWTADFHATSPEYVVLSYLLKSRTGTGLTHFIIRSASRHK